MTQALNKNTSETGSLQVINDGVVEMQVINLHAAGIDIGATEDWVACPPKDGKPNARKFRPPDLALEKWGSEEIR